MVWFGWLGKDLAGEAGVDPKLARLVGKGEPRPLEGKPPTVGKLVS